MPEIVTCSNCGKETYQGRASCPHCGGWLLDHPFTALAPDRPKVPDHPSFLVLQRAGAYRLQIDYSDLDLDRLMDEAGVAGFKRLTMRIACFLEPCIGALIMILKRPGYGMGLNEGKLANHFLRKSRATAVARAMAASATYYEDSVRSRTVEVEIL